ncbi:MAG: hypothetical protein AUH29_13150 [Candidatus Rokubacteria bacterium 13_1_40CM_69_27]|nr:MAG: hypothetical protein AUH29_13150 [Candidatus Rokubacteria bacterium 13_1_40CM_69_27]OLC30894.1 MAG: hypothetical protein AUH81_19015 [Candidatus Rokubacteria bacterium 13_1_40CM_4_69_5]OLE38126.1 MAG: hypothetical protein AUG00_06345 [Candidatus Rokubacteria bacterium 13_1_20CM_2_70_7]
MNGSATFSDRAYVVFAGLVVVALMIALAIAEAMGSERTPVAGMDAPWADDVVAVDEALAAKDLTAARWTLQRAYGVALGSRRWEGMIDVGDAAVRIGDVPRARNAYLAAVFRARTQRSLEGALRAAEASAGLGDRPVAEQCLRVAQELGGHDPGALTRVGDLAQRLADRSAAAGMLP